MSALHAAGRYWNAGIIVGGVNHAERIGLRLPSIGIKRPRLGHLVVIENLEDRHHLARFCSCEEFVVVIPPPRRDAGAEHPSLILRIAAWPRHDVEDANLEHIAGLRIIHRDRTGADMHAEPLARTAAEHRSVHRAGAAAIHVLAILGPGEHAFCPRIAGDHPLRIVGGMLRQGFDRDGVTGGDLRLRGQLAAEIAPVNSARLHGQMMVSLIRLPRTFVGFRRRRGGDLPCRA